MRVYSESSFPKYRRWRRHYLIQFYPGGVSPLPFSLWLGFPDRGILNCYELGMVIGYLLDALRPDVYKFR